MLVHDERRHEDVDDPQSDEEHARHHLRAERTAQLALAEDGQVSSQHERADTHHCADRVQHDAEAQRLRRHVEAAALKRASLK